MYKKLSLSGKLTNMRVNLAMLLFAPSAFDDSMLNYFINTRAELEGDVFPNLTARTVKIFADGVLGYPNQTSALIKPYKKFADPTCLDMGTPCEYVPNTYRSRVKVGQEKLNEIVRILDQNGFQVHIHAEGDQAVRSSLDAFAVAQEHNGALKSRANRHTLAHVDLVDKQDIPRFGQLNVSASVTFAWAAPGGFTMSLLPFLGEQRHKQLFLYKSLLKHRTRLVAVTDWPGSTLDIPQHFETGISRKIAEPYPGMPAQGEAFYATQSLTLENVIEAFTVNSAYSMFIEKLTGSIEVGKKADLVVLSKDLFAIPVDAISEVEVDMTFFNGQRVYSK
jgi:predicted amidohydrolase YtcJ